MISLGEMFLEATVENLRTVSHFIHAAGQRLDLTEKSIFDLDLAVDEAVTNIVKHAYPRDQHGQMKVAIQLLEDDMIQVTLTDWGVPIDPKNIKPFDKSAPIETRVHGGMGIYFIQTLMDKVERRLAKNPGDANELILTKRVDRLRPGAHRADSSRELKALMNVSQFMTTSSDQDKLLAQIVDQLLVAVDAEACTLYLLDDERDELFSQVMIEETGKLKEIRLKVGEGIAGGVAKSGEIVNIEDAYKDDRFIKTYDQITGVFCRTMLVAPMRNAQGKIIGVVQLINKRDGEFTSRDERLLAAITAQAAISVENARLYAQEMERQLINQELETARRIQKSFLPEVMPDHAGWDIGSYWHPMREVAGDFYDFYPLPDGRLAVLVADVSGKGIPAALFMALSVTVLRFAMSLGLSPSEMMSRANQVMLENQQSKMFTTAFVAYIDLESGEMEYASAGHNPPLVYRQGKFEYLEASGVAMGVFKAATYQRLTYAMYPGDILCLYTDGITEAMDEAENEFGEERLAEVIESYATEHSAQQITDAIMTVAHRFAAESGAFDDETLIIVKRRENP